MSTTPPPPPVPPPGQPGGSAPRPTPPGPWASDNLPPVPGAAVAVSAPPSIRSAVRLMRIGAALAVVQAILPLFQTGTLRDNIRDRDSAMTSGEVDAAVAVIVAFSIVIGVVAVGLWLWMAWANGKGMSWARVVASVFGGIGLTGSALRVASGQLTTLGVAGTLVYVALAVAILVLVWRPESSAYYRAAST